MISIAELTVRLGKSTIIHNLSADLTPAKVTAIVGPNGSGKTTLMRALTGELEFIGSVSINGHSLKALTALQQARIRGVLPQSSIVTFPFTVREIVRMGGLSSARFELPEDFDSRVDDVLVKVELTGYAGRRYTELSGGEQQRVQLARVLFQLPKAQENGDPKWLLLDEPVSSLDLRYQLIVMNIARDFANEGGGVIAIMHDINLTAMFADDLIMLQNGKMFAHGTPSRIINSKNISALYDCKVKVNQTPKGNTPYLLPHTAVNQTS